MEEAFKLGDQIAVLSQGKLIQLGSPVDLLARPASEFVRQLVGADNVMRQLQYLPITNAMDTRPEAVSSAHWDDVPEISTESTLLDALLQLLATNAPALATKDHHSQERTGYVTLISINREIAQLRQEAISQATSIL
jgi:osmoprotectant transport system ATP-binding protein